MAATATDLLAKLAGLGAVLEPRGDRLAIRFPEERRPEVEKLRPEVVRLKPELLKALAGQEAQAVQARIRGQEKTALVTAGQAETCWHCRGNQSCCCALCGRRGPATGWVSGPCGACHGTGRLAWPEAIQ